MLSLLLGLVVGLHQPRFAGTPPVGARVNTARPVKFSYAADPAVTSVAVVGGFNNWDRAKNPLTRGADGGWTVTASIEPGVYPYLFVEDGKRWVPDPKAPKQPDGNGNVNSLLIVQPESFDKLPGKKGDGVITYAAIQHRPDRRDTMRYDEKSFRIRVRTRHDDVTGVEIVSGDSSWPMEIIHSDALYDTWQGPLPAKSLGSYSFKFHDGHIGATIAGANYKQNVADYPVPKPPAWVSNAVFYQIFPERFANGKAANDPPDVMPWGTKPTGRNWMGGDLVGIQEHLDHLTDLGVTGLYLNPVFKTGSNHGYDTQDYLTVDPRFGTNQELASLVHEAHLGGIWVILDGVFNHSSPEFFAFRDLRAKGAKSKYRDWYFPLAFPIQVKEGQQTYRTFAGVPSMPKLNGDNPAVQEYFGKVAAHWISAAGVDGWRLDVADEVGHPFWRHFRTVVKAAKPDAYIVGETWGDSHEWLQGDEHDATMNYRWRSAVLDFVRGVISPTEFDRQLRIVRETCPAACLYSMFNLLGSHDTERVRTILKGNKKQQELAVVTQFTYPGVPSVYYGDEIGMEGGKDPDDRRCMIWDKSQWDMHLYRLHRALIALRKSRPSLTLGDFRVASANDAMGRFVFQRRLGKETTTVILNRGSVPVACSAYVPSGKVLAGTGPTVPAGGWAVVGS